MGYKAFGRTLGVGDTMGGGLKMGLVQLEEETQGKKPGEKVTYEPGTEWGRP
jgi:hypothetical protein